MPQSFLEVGDGHVLAHSGQPKVHVGPPVERVDVGSTMLANLQFEGPKQIHQANCHMLTAQLHKIQVAVLWYSWTIYLPNEMGKAS